MPDMGLAGLLFILFTLLIWGLLALGFLIVAARVITPVVLDEIAKHRASGSRLAGALRVKIGKP